MKQSIIPVEYKVLLELDPVEEKTAGGIIVPDSRREMQQMAQTEATLLAVGGNAFSDWAEPKPKVGDRVLIDQYAGQAPKRGEDLRRLCMDKDVVAIVR